MDYEYLQQMRHDYLEEILQHQLNWKNIEDSFEDMRQQWHDQSAQSFIAACVLQMQNSSKQLDITLDEHQKLLTEILTYFQSLEANKNEFHHLCDIFLKLNKEQSDFIKKCKNTVVDSENDSELALQKIEEAKVISYQLVSM